ncbi:MAG TPA: imidazolonepropionase [Opitutus sp.]|nr:imidazolonepropionase [Opitutus sp.]
MSVIIRNARVLALAGGPGPRRGAALGEFGVRARADVLVSGDRIAAVGGQLTAPRDAEVIDADGRVLLPGFVDAHTHACWAGDRLEEWAMKRRGVPYLEVLRQGGGIHATVRAVRAASEEELAADTLARLEAMRREGTTTAEVKSGYGLSTADELKMLRAIRDAGRRWAGTVVPTALLGHACEGEADAFVARTIAETLPAVTREFPGIAVDAFCEESAWSRAACEALFRAAMEHGHPVRVHADQFNSLGMIPAAVALGARSVDHLEAATDADLGRLAASDTMGVILPATGFHTDGRYARAREFVDAGGAVVLATNCNPGSAPTHSLPMAIALAVRFCGLTPAEAIAACTVNAAALLGLPDRGTIEVGQRADLVLLRHRDERMLAYEFGGNPVERVICGGAVVV